MLLMKNQATLRGIGNGEKHKKNIIIYLENVLKSTCGLDIFAQTAMFGCLLQLIVKDVNAVSGMTPSQTYPHV